MSKKKDASKKSSGTKNSSDPMTDIKKKISQEKEALLKLIKNIHHNH